MQDSESADGFELGNAKVLLILEKFKCMAMEKCRVALRNRILKMVECLMPKIAKILNTFNKHWKLQLWQGI